MNKHVASSGKYYDMAADIFKTFGEGEFVVIETPAAKHARALIYRGYIKHVGERGFKKTYRLTRDAVERIRRTEGEL